MAKYGLVIDLKRCIGCMSCTIACKVENGTRPGVFWNIVKDQEFGKFPDVKRFFLSVQCAHCENPPCVEVCPTGAGYKRDDGIVMIDFDKCVGCRYCVEACPYGARFFNNEDTGYFGRELTAQEKIVYQNHKVGTPEKCTFCAHRLEQGKKPACVQSCVGKARFFGDLDDPESEVSRIIVSSDAQQLRKELDTGPLIYYIFP